MISNISFRKNWSVLMSMLLASCMLVAFFGVPVNANAAVVATPQSAVSAVVSATTSAKLAAGVSVSGDPANTPPIVSTSSKGEVSGTSPSGTTLGIKLPVTPKVATQVQGATSLSTASSVYSVVNPTTGGIQISQDMLGPSAPTSYSYKLTLPTGYKLVSRDVGPLKGSIALTTASGSTPIDQTNTIGFINPAWAVDANGKAVPTSYSVSGLTVTQTVNTASVKAWPVVADPTVSFGWVVYIHFFHAEVGAIVWTGFFTGLVTALGIACTKVPVPWVAAACAVFVAVAFAMLFASFQTAFARGGGEVLMFQYSGSYAGYMYVGNNWS